MPLKVLVADWAEEDRGRRIAESFAACLVETWYCSYSGTVKANEWDIDVEIPSDIDMVILHHNNRDLLDRYAPEAKVNSITIRFTGASSVPPTSDAEFWIQRAVTQINPVTVEEARSILTWAQRYADGHKVRMPEVLR